MKGIRWKVAFALVPLVVLALAGCAAPASSPAASPAKQSAAPAQSSPPAASSPAPAASPSSSPSSSPASDAAARYQKALQGWDQVVAAAKKEGKVVLYATPNATTKARVALFQQAYPDIKVELVGLRGPQAVDKIATEASTGHGIGDVSLAGWTSTTAMADKGYFAVWFVPAALKPGVSWVMNPYDVHFRPQGDVVALCAYTSTGVLINTDKVSKDKEPKTWMDLLDPFYKDRTAMQPLNASAGVELFNFVVKPKLNLDAFVKGVKALNPYYSTNIDQQVQLVITGDRYAYWPVANQNVMPYLLKGNLPLKYIAPGPQIVGSALGLAIMKTAPDPNAAKVFENWLMTVNAQEEQAKAGASAIVKGVPVPSPVLDLGSNVYKGVEVFWQSAAEAATSSAASKEATKLFGLQ